MNQHVAWWRRLVSHACDAWWTRYDFQSMFNPWTIQTPCYLWVAIPFSHWILPNKIKRKERKGNAPPAIRAILWVNGWISWERVDVANGRNRILIKKVTKIDCWGALGQNIYRWLTGFKESVFLWSLPTVLCDHIFDLVVMSEDAPPMFVRCDVNYQRTNELQLNWIKGFPLFVKSSVLKLKLLLTITLWIILLVDLHFVIVIVLQTNLLSVC